MKRLGFSLAWWWRAGSTINDDLTQSNWIRGLAYNPAVMLGAVPMIPLLLVYALWQRLRTVRTARARSSVSAREDSDERGRV